ncbi:MAG: hypothetical protein JRI23_25610, partial [Deltaproteobacteria bacterium]|jgi:asparagine synthase (glutamine-hydrolysing)|nr:hypothetical protein [Deltaproteobacteria bacterium]MBW2535403.1 hypothetical protein [Deltaproteobacteria bacterium]
VVPFVTRAAVDDALVVVYQRLRVHAERALGPVESQVVRELERFTTSVPLWQSDQLAAHLGLELRHPFMDRRLVELVVPMPYWVRLRRGVVKRKPLLRRASQARLPAEVLERSDVAEYTPLIARALLEDHRDQTADLFASDSRLGDLGLVDLPALREAIRARQAASAHRLAFLVAMELWLRHGFA